MKQFRDCNFCILKTMSKSRQLAAIMFTDIVGYSALMGEDEQKAFKLLANNRSLQHPIITKFNGRWLKEIGDGVLASFSTVSDAVYCAKEIQEKCGDESELELRIGIHVGEVVFEGNDVFGDGVNIASRIQSIAPAGGIYISESVLRNVENKEGIQAEFVGEKKLKNVRHPVKIFRIQSEEQRGHEKASQLNHQREGSDKSIAVLPFVNMSSDPEQEYFSDGLTEDLITDLSQVNGLSVISRSSAMAFKGSNKRMIDIARELAVKYILEGSVRKSSMNIRVNARLIDAVEDVNLWSEKFSGQLDDIFTIQDKVSKSIVEALSLRLSHAEFSKLSEKPIQNPRAYELYQKAQYEMFQFREDGLKRALRYLDDALKIEGENPFIHAKKGAALCNLLNVANKVDRNVFNEIRRLADKVFELSPNSPMGYILLGYLSLYIGNIRDAVMQVQTAYNANPNDFDNLWLLILGYSYLGQSAEAEKYSVVMGEVDPYNPVYHALSCLVYYMKGDLTKAVIEIDKAYQVFPEVPQVQLYYAYFLVIDGKYHEAVPILDRYISNTAGSIFSVIGKLFKTAIHEPDNGFILSQVEEEKLKIDVEWSWLVADFYSLMKSNELALDWLEHAANRGFINYPLFSKFDPFLENIRKEPRFENLMSKVKLLYHQTS